MFYQAWVSLTIKILNEKVVKIFLYGQAKSRMKQLYETISSGLSEVLKDIEGVERHYFTPTTHC